jgi:molybdopterin molybdotransferase
MSEPDVTNLINVQQAIEIIDAAPIHLRTSTVKLAHAKDRFLARDLHTDREFPPYNKSIMDGYAVRNADVGQPNTELRVIGEARAGYMVDKSITQGQTMRIMTGAELPAGADAVVPVEFTERTENGIKVTKTGDYTRFVSWRGSNCPGGVRVLSKGAKLGAAQLAVAATVGQEHLEVFATPRVAVMATGDELVDPAVEPMPFQIRNSNTIMVNSLLSNCGCEVTDLGIVKDDFRALTHAITSGLDYDALFITGGMSVGDYDIPPKVLEQLHATFHITKLKIKPGKPFIFAHMDTVRDGHSHRCYIFGLPGNPLAGFVCTVRLACRLMRRLCGGEPFCGWLRGTLATDLPPNGPREFYQPAMFDGQTVQPLEWKGSADVFTLASANALLIRDADEPAQSAGSICRVMRV